MPTISHYIFSSHAREEMEKRNISQAIVESALKQPDSTHDVRPGRIVVHKTFIAPDSQKALLYRIFVDIDHAPPVVVTVYKTSKITKYEKPQ